MRVVSGGHIVGTALTLSVSGGNEQGLPGVAFSPDGTKLYATRQLERGLKLWTPANNGIAGPGLD